MNRWHLKQAALHIQSGGVIAYPTEAVYGLGCDPYDPVATQYLLDLKMRSMEKGLILIAANLEQIEPFIKPMTKSVTSRIGKTWPGPTTWLLPARPETPYWLRGSHNNIAVRITAHPLASALCLAVGSALISTSANVSKHPPARSALDVQRIFGGRVDYILHGATGKEKRPTRIRDAISGATIRTN